MNDATFFRPDTVNNWIDAFATRLRDALTEIGNADLLNPDREEFRVRPHRYSALAIEVDLHLAPGAVVKVAAPFTCDDEAMRASIAKIVERLTGLLADLDAMTHFRGHVERQARAMMEQLAREGVQGRVIEVRLGAVDLVLPSGAGEIEVLVEGSACHMLRPFRQTWRVSDLEALEEAVARFRTVQRERNAKRRAANALGAVGYIDTLALALIDDRSEGRKVTLQEIARQFDFRWYRDLGDVKPEAYGLAWYDGVVRPNARLSDRLFLSDETVVVHGAAIDQSAVGRPVSDFVDHPWLDGISVSAIDDIRDEFAEIRLDTPVLMFTADGEVLTNG
ncbi:MAG: hypothetical protein ACTHM8_03185 [Sphingomonas sp.]